MSGMMGMLARHTVAALLLLHMIIVFYMSRAYLNCK